MSSFLRVLSVWCMTLFVGSAFADNYMCTSSMNYTSCNDGYDLDTSVTPNTCILSPDNYICATDRKYTSCEQGYYLTYSNKYNALPEPGNSCSSCPSTATHCPGRAAAPMYKVTLDYNGGDGALGAIYAGTTGGWHINTTETSSGTAVEKLSSLPTKVGCKFNGYKNGSQLAIDENGEFQEWFTGAAMPYTLYASWTCMDTTVSTPNKIYDGTALTCGGVTVTSPEGATIEYSTDGGSSWSGTIPTRKNAGKTVVQYRVSKTGYTPLTGSFDCIVNKATGVAQIKDGDTVVWSGVNQYPSIKELTAVCSEAPASGITVSSNQESIAKAALSGTTITLTPVVTGAATITLSCPATTNYNASSAKYTFFVANGVISADKTDKTKIYDGAALTCDGVTVTSPEGATIEYSTDGGSTWSDTVPTRTDVGTTAVQYRVSKANYQTVMGSFNCTVNNATMTVSATNKTLTYNGTTTSNGTAQSCANVTVSAPASGATILYNTNGTSTYTETVPTLTNEGSQTVYYQVVAENYTTVTGSYKCTIQPGSMTVSAPNVSKVYNGSAQSCANVTVSVPASGATILYNTNGTDTYSETAPTLTDAGTQMVYYKVTAENFTDVTGSYECDIFAASGTAYFADGSEKATSGETAYPTNKVLTAVCPGAPTSGITVSSNQESIAKAALSGTTITLTPVATGTVTITLSCPETTNYSASSATYELTVVKGNNTLRLSATSGSMAYSVSATFTIETNISEGKLSVKTSDSDVATATISGKTVTITSKAKYGTADITVTSDATANYNSATETYKVTVNKGTITLDNQSADSAGTVKIYQTYNTNVYLTTWGTSPMSETANKITPPTKEGYSFDGYYDSTEFTTKYISSDGYITSSGLAAGKALKANGIWYAKWTPKQYTVTYDCNGGNMLDTEKKNQTVDYGTAFTLYPNDFCTRTGYEFIGWSGDCAECETYDKSYDTTLSAQWQAINYTCEAGSYLPRNSTECAPCLPGYYCEKGTYNYNSADQGLSSCEEPYKYSDSGAQTANMCYQMQEVSVGVIPTNCSNATWQACEYRDYYDQDDTPCVPKQEDLTYVWAKAGAYVNGMTCAVCEGNTYQDTDGANFATCTSCLLGYSISGTSLANHDSPLDCSRVITLDKNGGSGNVSSSVTCNQSVACEFGSASALEQEGYTFTGGWGASKDCTTSTSKYTSPSESVYYACKTANKYNITFDANGGSGGQTDTVKATYNSIMPTIDTTAPTRTGYTFMGWYDNATYTSGTQYYTAVGYSAHVWDKTQNTTLYAGWKPNTYTVTIDKNGGSGQLTVGGATKTGTDKVTFSCTYGSTYTLPAWDGSTNALTKTNYVFTGWDTTSPVTCSGAKTIKAQWTAPTCSANNGKAALSGVTDNRPQCSVICDTGYSKNGGTDYTATFTVIGSAGSTGANGTCSAITYTVTYDCGLGSGSAPSNATIQYNKEYTPEVNTCTAPSGEEFSHWFDGTTNRFPDEEFIWSYTSNTTLTAVYVTSGAESIVYDTDGGDIISYNGAPMACNKDTATFTLPSEVVRPGHSFEGWLDADNNIVTIVEQGTCTSVLTFTAKWTPCTSNTDGDCNCASGSHPDNGTCVECVKACSTLGSTYQGEYSVCANDGTGNAETQCYEICSGTKMCAVDKSLCPTSSCGYKYEYGVSIKYYGATACVAGTVCDIDYITCKSGEYYSPVGDLENGQCLSCSSLPGGYNKSNNVVRPTSDIGERACFKTTDLPCTPPVCPPSERGTCDYNAAHVKAGGGYLYYPGDGVARPGSAAEYTCPSALDNTQPADWSCFTGYDKNISDYADEVPLPEELCVPHVYTIKLSDYNGDVDIYETYATNWSDSTGVITKLTVPVRTGYTFQGYYNQQTGGTKVIGTDGVLPANNTYTTDTTLYAQWTEIQYDITYHLDGGSYGSGAVYSYTIEDTPVALIQPTKRGYDFEGWFSDSAFENEVTEIPAGSTGAREFWAKWSPTEYTITYNLDNGTNNANNPTMYTIVDTPIVLEKPSKPGYTFNKWIDENGDTVVRIAKDAIGNIVLTAVWLIDSYSITYDIDGGINNHANPISYVISDTPVKLEAPEKTGYVFDGWTGDLVVQENGAYYIKQDAAADTTVVANWVPTQFTVHFDTTDATGVSVPDVTCIYDQECKAAAAVSTAHKEFSGWNTHADGKGKSIAAGDSMKNLVSDGGEITLYATWDQIMVGCEAGYYYNNGVKTQCVLGQYCPGDGHINSGATGCIETCPAGGATVIQGASSIGDCRKIMITGGDMTFTYGTAKWDCAYRERESAYREDCQAIVLTCDAGYYYVGDGKPTCVPVQDGYYSPAPTVANGEQDEASQNAYACPGETGVDDGIGSDLPRALKTNCYSLCALTKADVANSKTVTPDNPKSFSTADGQYPVCSYTIKCNTGYTTPENGTEPKCDAKEYIITLDKNQGTGDVETSTKCTFDSGSCPLPANSELTRAGYVSAGKWCTETNGSGTCYTAGQATTANVSSTGTAITLYAAWEPDVFKVDLIASDATENAEQSPVYLKYTVGWFQDESAKKTITALDALPGKSGYHFAGYSTNGVMIIDGTGTLQTTDAALRVTTVDTVANVAWSKGETTCQAGHYYNGYGGECSVCEEDHWCPGGVFKTDSGIIGGHEKCPDNGWSTGGITATDVGVCYKQGLAYMSVSGNASGTQTCNYDKNARTYSKSCRDISVKSCVAGYYYESGNDCIEVGKNNYSGVNELGRHACPESGLTVSTTSTEIYDCFKTVEYTATYGSGTQVCNYTSTQEDGTARYATDCKDEYITSCQGGYYRENELATDCVAVGENAYSEVGSLKRTPCPDDGKTNINNAPAPTACFKARNPFESEHGSGVRHCTYEPQSSAYTFCDKKIFEQCEAGYYWNAYGDEDCTPVGYGFFGPVADAGNEGLLTARQACASFNNQQGYTETETSGTASACYMMDIVCSVENGGGVKDCGYNTNSEDYSAKCSVCRVNHCKEQYYLADNKCSICPAGSICDEQTRIGANGVANAKPQLCSELFNGRYPDSDMGSISVAQCFGACDKLANVQTMSGRDYQGADIADTCEIKQCKSSYYLTNNKLQCNLCPENSVCDEASGSDTNLDGVPDGVPQTCDVLTGGSHKLSSAGSTKIDQCYVTCADYEILGGTAIRDFDTVQYNNVCTYKGKSETGNPCEIKLVNGYEACIEESCNYDYELIDGHCQKCNRDNAQAYKQNGNCVVALCDDGYHPSGDKCVDNIRECAVPNAKSATQVWDDKTGAFGVCKITSCEDGYHIESNTCVSNTEVCAIEHGLGIREWNEYLDAWDDCIATSCEAGYTNNPAETDEVNKQCGRCSNAKSSLDQIAVSTYSEGCTIAACMYQGELYNLENNECVPICSMDTYEDETGFMRWNSVTKKCERKCFDGYMSW